MRTSYRRGEIHHIDIALINGTDSRLNRYTILSRVPDTAPGRDLTDALRLTEFGNLQKGVSYTYVLRLFLNREPHIELRSASFQTRQDVCTGYWPVRRCSEATTVATVLVNIG
ncbi:hypothetical protein [Ulvibacter antarcticus]|nr:hypothetical protein [Ulvibacter antarcticus]